MAKHLRNGATKPECILWRHLRGRKCDGYKFRRQTPIGPYIVDFFCPQKNLVIEVDGSFHETTAGIIHDTKRDAFLSQKGVRTLRISNAMVKNSLPRALEIIRANLRK